MKRVYPLIILLATGCLLLTPRSTSFAQVRIEAEAYSGTPFGVGRVTLRSGGEFRVNRVPRPGGGRIADLARRIAAQAGAGPTVDLQSIDLSVVEKSHRVLYPVFARRDRPVLKQFVEVPSESTAYFLFTGDAPLELTTYAPDAVAGAVTPRIDPAGHARLLSAWWQEYSAASRGDAAPRDYPQMVETYLTGMLGRRLQLALPPLQPPAGLQLMRGELALLAGTESARISAARQILAGSGVEAATVPLPEELPAPEPEALEAPAEVPIEPIATRVPVECLYVRFGSFPNFQWLRHRTEDWGGELRDVISERGLDYGLNDRMQKQLGLREGKLAEVFGDKVIADVALIGTDAFMREGAAIGTLFHARSNLALGNDLTQQRRTSMREVPGAKEEQLTIAGKPVSYISTPDGTMRSYYVVDGEFHLVTTSRQIVEWFLGTAAGTHRSLAQSEAFRSTRMRLPLERNDTVLVYLSPEFFENLLGAHYHIEMQRRLRSDVEMEMLPVAQLAAKGEGSTATTLDELIAANLLPPGFGRHADGGQLVVEDGKLIDTTRGARGSFLPVPDVKIDNVTPAEAAEYQQFRDYYVNQWGRMEPVALAIRREELPEGKLERVVVDALAAPLAPKHIETLAGWLGDPTTQRLAPIAGDVVSFQAHVRGGGGPLGGLLGGGELLGGVVGGGALGGGANNAPYQLFGALRNADPAIALSPNTGLLARILQMQLQGVQGYFGAWPHPGLLAMLGGASNLPPDPAGYTRLRTGLWRRQFDQFTLLSFHPEILEQVTPAIQFVEAPRPAQVWIHAEDLATSTLAPLINAYGYKQARKIAEGNTRFMNLLIEQLHVPPAEARATSERLLNARLIEPLGGDYELRASGGRQQWVSTAVANHPDMSPPADYQFRALTWLRGADLELLVQGGPAPALSFHGEFIMPVTTRAPAFELPKLPFGLGGDKNKPAAAPPAQPGPTPAASPPAKPAPAPPKPTPPRPSRPREL